jgi:hypothetical protein
LENAYPVPTDYLPSFLSQLPTVKLLENSAAAAEAGRTEGCRLALGLMTAGTGPGLMAPGDTILGRYFGLEFIALIAGLFNF